MGYYTSFRGALTLSRPLTWQELTDAREAEDFTFQRESHKTHTPEGVLEVITATAIVPRGDDETRAYDAESQLQAMAEALPADVALSGEIRGDGEETGDARRYVVQGGTVRELKPRLVWDDGYSEPGR